MVHASEARNPEKTNPGIGPNHRGSERRRPTAEQLEAARVAVARAEFTRALETRAASFAPGQNIGRLNAQGEPEDWEIADVLNQGTPDARLALQREHHGRMETNEISAAEAALEHAAMEYVPALTAQWDAIVADIGTTLSESQRHALQAQKGEAILGVAKEATEREALGRLMDIQRTLAEEVNAIAHEARHSANDPEKTESFRLSASPLAERDYVDLFDHRRHGPGDRMEYGKIENELAPMPSLDMPKDLSRTDEEKTVHYGNDSFEGDDERTELRSPAELREERDRITRRINELAAEMPTLQASDRKARMAELVELVETKRQITQTYEKAKTRAEKQKTKEYTNHVASSTAAMAETRKHLQKQVANGELPGRHLERPIPLPNSADEKVVDEETRKLTDIDIALTTSEKFIAQLTREIDALRSKPKQTPQVLETISQLQGDIRHQDARRKKALAAWEAMLPPHIRALNGDELRRQFGNDKKGTFEERITRAAQRMGARLEQSHQDARADQRAESIGERAFDQQEQAWFDTEVADVYAPKRKELDPLTYSPGFVDVANAFGGPDQFMKLLKELQDAKLTNLTLDDINKAAPRNSLRAIIPWKNSDDYIGRITRAVRKLNAEKGIENV